MMNSAIPERLEYTDVIDRVITRSLYQGAMIAFGCNPDSSVIDQLVELTTTMEDLVSAIMSARKLTGSARAFPGHVHTMLDTLRARQQGR